jgi:hypothetical protein
VAGSGGIPKVFANGEAAVTLPVLAVIVVVAKLALTGIGQIGWAGLNRVWTPVLVPAPFGLVPIPVTRNRE